MFVIGRLGNAVDDIVSFLVKSNFLFVHVRRSRDSIRNRATVELQSVCQQSVRITQVPIVK